VTVAVHALVTFFVVNYFNEIIALAVKLVRGQFQHIVVTVIDANLTRCTFAQFGNSNDVQRAFKLGFFKKGLSDRLGLLWRHNVDLSKRYLSVEIQFPLYDFSKPNSENIGFVKGKVKDD